MTKIATAMKILERSGLTWELKKLSDMVRLFCMGLFLLITLGYGSARVFLIPGGDCGKAQEGVRTCIYDSDGMLKVR